MGRNPWRDPPSQYTENMDDQNREPGSWKYGIFDCFKPQVDAMCLYSCFCNPCDIYDQTEIVDPQKGLAMFLLTICCGPRGPAFAIRKAIREKENIPGNCVGDLACAFCCTSCMFAQQRKQLEPQVGCIVKDLTKM